jgi:hypothetical protein
MVLCGIALQGVVAGRIARVGAGVGPVGVGGWEAWRGAGKR